VDQVTWGRAITIAPLVGVALATVAWLVAWGVQHSSDSALLAAVCATAVLALLTRGLHLDGLADVADGLGSGKPPAEATAIMRRSDIGPFGVVTVALTLLVQVTAIQVAMSSVAGVGAIAVIGGSAMSRAAMTVTCRRGVPAATDGLAAQVVGSVSARRAALMSAAAVAIVTVATVLGVASDVGLGAAVACLAALLVGELWWRHCAGRLGAVTGDVLGSVEELAFTTFVLVLVLAV
jgi:adenosylcobinamide-GDP ribazoletransferase